MQTGLVVTLDGKGRGTARCDGYGYGGGYGYGFGDGYGDGYGDGCGGYGGL